MRIAILLKDENFIDEGVVQAYTFTVEEDTVVGIGSEILMVKNLEYLFIWLTGKRVDVVFTEYNSDEEIENAFRKVGIKIKSLREIKNNPLLREFLIKNIEE